MSFRKPQVAIIIPARFGSTRLPGKPLADIAGKPMVQHVWERASEVKGAYAVIVATDDQRVVDVVHGFGGVSLMTSPTHPSGTDRLVEVMTLIDADIYINLQGDEPLVRPADIEALAAGMIADSTVLIGTLCHPIESSEAKNPNTVKVVLANNDNALYFSRSPIPYPRDSEVARYFKHVGVYGYRREVLAQYSELPQPMLENAEKLEQLRLMSAGYLIRTFMVEPTGPGVDTPECLTHVRALMSGQPVIAKKNLGDIKLVITDVDGVLTDGGIYYDETGECLKRFHARDGMGMRMLEENGVRVAVLSGRDSPTLRKRVADLGITLCQFGVKDKRTACLEFMADVDTSYGQTACIGDDSIDLPAFEVCGTSFAVADAPSYVKAAATHVLQASGGTGAFREVADAVLIAQGKFEVLSTASGYSSAMEKMTQ